MPAGNLWKVDAHGVHREYSPKAFQSPKPRAITLSHPAYPYVGAWGPAELDPVGKKFVPKVVGEYLKAVSDALGLPADLLQNAQQFSKRPNSVQLTWLPIPKPSVAPPVTEGRNSFWFRRYNPAVPGFGKLLDRTAVFLAVHSILENDPNKALGSRLGIRITAHVDPKKNGPWPVRITGITCSEGFTESLDADPDFENLGVFAIERFGTTPLAARIVREAGLPDDYVGSIEGVRVLRVVPQEGSFIVYVNAPRPSETSPTPGYALSAKVTLRPGKPERLTVQVLERSPSVAHAAVEPRLFQVDPWSQAPVVGSESRRPKRAPNRLRPYLTKITLPGITATGGPNPKTTLFDTVDHNQVMVTESTLVDPNADPTKPKTVSLKEDARYPRNNDFAALSAYQHARISLFDRMRGYGLSPAEYFRAAALPLLIDYRSGMTPGPARDGKTVNAQVEYDPSGVRVRFALADVARSTSEREPLGLSSDPRWSWHEFGHVLLAASTGALEFLFAHSAGDALAAIVADPTSGLADERRARGITFPWARLSRRHDRSVWHGWSWCGRYHRQAWFPSVVDNRRHKGYDSEQILSSSLFRAYLALGGETKTKLNLPDVAIRKDASDYMVYLIMRAMGELGSSSMAPIQTPGQLLDALAKADAGTSSTAPGKRVGGCAHKVIRWAFEAQGLNASADWMAVRDEPGQPPDIDLFIDDGRPNSEGPFPRGGYMPVSLDWHAWPNPSPWHATSGPNGAIRVTPAKTTVMVNNRGHLAANNVVVRAWYKKWNGPAGTPPKWNAPGWKFLGASAAQNVPDRTGAVPVAFDIPAAFATLAGHYLVVAEASSEDDPANSDAASGLACSSAKTPLIDLIAGDNNLGLVVHKV